MIHFRRETLSNLHARKFGALKVGAKPRISLTNEATNCGHLLRENSENENHLITYVGTEGKTRITCLREIANHIQNSYRIFGYSKKGHDKKQDPICK
jgi:hypothetical protein